MSEGARLTSVANTVFQVHADFHGPEKNRTKAWSQQRQHQRKRSRQEHEIGSNQEQVTVPVRDANSADVCHRNHTCKQIQQT